MIEELRSVLNKRQHLELNDDFALMECWKQEMALLTEDLAGTISFLSNCTDEEFYWLSEVFDDLMAETQSNDIMNALCKRFERVRDQEKRDSILTDLKFSGIQLQPQDKR